MEGRMLAEAGLQRPDAGLGRRLRLAEGTVAFTPQETDFFFRLFLVVDSDEDGEISASQATTFLRRSRLSKEVLKDVWRWAFGGESRSKLKLAEWFVALKLVALGQHTGHVPSRDALFNGVALPLPQMQLVPVPPDSTVDVSDALDSNLCCVSVSNPVIKGKGMSKFVQYEVITTTQMPQFYRQAMHVRRRYSDFVWLRERLCRSYPATNVPPIPGKRVLGNLDPHFIEDRRLCLGEFLMHVMRHPKLNSAFDLQVMLDASENGLTEYRALTVDAEAKQLEAAVAVALAKTSLASPSNQRHQQNGLPTATSVYNPNNNNTSSDIPQAVAAAEEGNWLYSEPALGVQSQHQRQQHGDESSSGNETEVDEEEEERVALGNDSVRVSGVSGMDIPTVLVDHHHQKLRLYQVALSDLARSLGCLLGHAKAAAQDMETSGADFCGLELKERQHIENTRRVLVGISAALGAQQQSPLSSNANPNPDGGGGARMDDNETEQRQGDGNVYTQQQPALSSNGVGTGMDAHNNETEQRQDYTYLQDTGQHMDALAEKERDSVECMTTKVLGPLRYLFGEVKAMRHVLDAVEAKRLALQAARRSVVRRKDRYEKIRHAATMADVDASKVDEAISKMQDGQRQVALLQIELREIVANVTKELMKYERERLNELTRVAVAFVQEQIRIGRERAESLQALHEKLTESFVGELTIPHVSSTSSSSAKGMRTYYDKRQASQKRMATKFKQVLGPGLPLQPPPRPPPVVEPLSSASTPAYVSSSRPIENRSLTPPPRQHGAVAGGL